MKELLIIPAILILSLFNNKERNNLENTNKTEKILNEEKNLDLNQNVENKTSNVFEDVEYKGIDSAGNRFSIESERAEFEIDNPNMIKMTKMIAYFFFKDGTTLKIIGDYGTYNNKSNDMEFRENIIANYIDNNLYADNLDYLNSKNLLTIYGNVKTESIKGNISADNIEIDISKRTVDLSMFGNGEVKVKIRN